MYVFALTLHIVTAIIGLGQTFLIPLFLYLPKNPSQVHYTNTIMKPMGKIANYSDWVLLSTGLFMVAFGYWNLSHDWIGIALVLFIGIRISSKVLSSKTSKALKEVMSDSEENIDFNEFIIRRKEYLPYLLWVQFLNLLIILDMIVKPNF